MFRGVDFAAVIVAAIMILSPMAAGAWKGDGGSSGPARASTAPANNASTSAPTNTAPAPAH